MRAGSTYRAAKRNAKRGDFWKDCKFERTQRGETRSEFDRRRHYERLQNKGK